MLHNKGIECDVGHARFFSVSVEKSNDNDILLDYTPTYLPTSYLHVHLGIHDTLGTCTLSVHLHIISAPLC